MRIIALILCFIYALWAGPKDTPIIAVEDEAPKINPAYSEDHDVVIGLISSGLIRFDENVKVKPDLVKSWSTSRDGLVYELELRDDALWYDGVKFSVKDVKSSLEAFRDPKNNAEIHANFKDIRSIKLLGDYKIKITLSCPSVGSPDPLSAGMLPSHLLENENLSTSKFNQNPVGTGAFEFEKWKKGEYVNLVVNEDSHLGRVKSKRLILRHINDANATVAELKNGKIDAALIDSSLLRSFESDKKFKVLREKSADYRALMFNLENEFLRDKNVRLALNYVVNKQAIVDNILHGYGFIASHPLENSRAAPKEFKNHIYNVKKAGELLQKAGFKKNEKGLYVENGKILSFDIYTTSNDPLCVSLAGILQSEFKKSGMEAKVVAKFAGSFDYSKADSFLIGWGSPYDPDFHTYRVPGNSQDTSKNSSGWNFRYYNDENADEVLEKARNSLDPQERKKYYAQFINAPYENPPSTFLTHLDSALVYKANLKGVKPRILGHHGVGFIWNIYERSQN